MDTPLSVAAWMRAWTHMLLDDRFIWGMDERVGKWQHGQHEYYLRREMDSDDSFVRVMDERSGKHRTGY